MPVLDAGSDEDDVPGMKLPRRLPPFLVPAFPVGDEEDLRSSLTNLLVLKGELRRFQSTFRSLAEECGAKGDLALVSSRVGPSALASFLSALAFAMAMPVLCASTSASTSAPTAFFAAMDSSVS